jgi:hypothetical protein
MILCCFNDSLMYYLSLSLYIYMHTITWYYMYVVYLKKYNIYIYLFMYVYPSWLVEYATNVMPTPFQPPAQVERHAAGAHGQWLDVGLGPVLVGQPAGRKQLSGHHLGPGTHRSTRGDVWNLVWGGKNEGKMVRNMDKLMKKGWTILESWEYECMVISSTPTTMTKSKFSISRIVTATRHSLSETPQLLPAIPQ